MSVAAADSTPKFKAAGFACPHCRRNAHQDWEALYIWEGDDDESGGFEPFKDGPQSYVLPASVVRTLMAEKVPPPDPDILENQWKRNGQEWWASRCFNCKRAALWRGERIMYPGSSSTMPAPHPDMEGEPRELYDEAREVFTVSPRAGAALARATLERLLKDLDPEAGKIELAGRIERIVPQVSTSLGQMLTVLRHVGNKSLHVEDQTDDVTMLLLSDEQTQTAALLFESINPLVDELVTKRAVAKSTFDMLPAGVRARIEPLLKKNDEQAPSG